MRGGRCAKVVRMTNLRDQGVQVMREMLPGLIPDDLPNDQVDFGSSGFAGELMDIGLEGIFGRLWTREGLARRDRSLVTLGILIALGAEDELESHFKIAKQNGLTEDELAEVIYHASGYAGFPAANTAKAAAMRGLKK
jgi:4-carboxymuconolactone decarboxylase